VPGWVALRACARVQKSPITSADPDRITSAEPERSGLPNRARITYAGRQHLLHHPADLTLERQMQAVFSERHLDREIQRVQSSAGHAQWPIDRYRRSAACASILRAYVLLEHEAALNDVDLFGVLSLTSPLAQGFAAFTARDISFV
jgi:hypothetical protein